MTTEKTFKKKIQDLDSKIALESRKKGMHFCPSCGSTNVKPQIYGLAEKAAALSPKLLCIDCNFYGFMMKGTLKEIGDYKKERN